MVREKLKFVAGAVIILGVLTWLGFTGYQESKTYYLTLPELREEGERAHSMRLRVAGDVLPGSIHRKSGQVTFTLHQGEETLEVVYTGTDPLPDTLVDDAQAVVTGTLSRDDVFQAKQVQAKCASKYEALPPGAQPEGGDARSY
ncbi:MAG: cytochrome c maturation protein CcmE [Terriglobia bacterium]